MSNEDSVEDGVVGEVHLLFRGDNQVEVSTSFSVAELNLALDTVKFNILNGELNPQEV